jgi:hypothetical protein
MLVTIYHITRRRMPEKIILIKTEVYNYIAEFTLLAFIRVDFGILCKPALRRHHTWSGLPRYGE